MLQYNKGVTDDKLKLYGINMVDDLRLHFSAITVHTSAELRDRILEYLQSSSHIDPLLKQVQDLEIALGLRKTTEEMLKYLSTEGRTDYLENRTNELRRLCHENRC